MREYEGCGLASTEYFRDPCDVIIVSVRAYDE
jgi:hypothetical protein